MSITDIGGRATRRPAGFHAFAPHRARGSSRPADEAVAGEPPSGRVADFADAASLEALDAAGAEGAEAARLARAWAEATGDAQDALACAFDRELARWAMAAPESLRVMLDARAMLDLATSAPFDDALACAADAVVDAETSALRACVARHRRAPTAESRDDLLARLRTFRFAMMTGPVALRAAVDRALAARAAAPERQAGFAEAPARFVFDGASAPADASLRLLTSRAFAGWAAGEDEADAEAARTLRGRLLEDIRAADAGAAAEAAARSASLVARARVAAALDEPPDAGDLRDMSEAVLRLFAPLLLDAPGLDMDWFAARVAVFAARAPDGPALRAGGAPPLDMGIRFEGALGGAGLTKRRLALAAFTRLYASGVLPALATFTQPLAAVRRLVDAADGPDMVIGAARLVDAAHPHGRALDSRRAVKRLCEAAPRVFGDAWRRLDPHEAAVAACRG